MGETESKLSWLGLPTEASGAQSLVEQALEGSDLQERKTKPPLRCGIIAEVSYERDTSPCSSICINFKIAYSCFCNLLCNTLVTTQESFVKVCVYVCIHSFIQENQPKDLIA